ncbi:hypothetical protein [Phaeobacter sp. 22II1-1F12B]|uniref:hypothetical protein n=1 Tax=Phaeobacter sp. 22II1-1F12B TaxID=1317111 RepID=UPI000B51FDA2|nr:hypothetical protein [Phaeobacter sp. 22II1-1F12B]OWU69057.1 hypothetical protein ATO1_24860 [Phaeobacter sp. 22II1-1F12B]
MNTKQFISSLIFHGADLGVSRIPLIGPVISAPLRLIFPEMAYERTKFNRIEPRVLLSVYIAGLVICFVLQAFLAFQRGVLGSISNGFMPGLPRTERIMFLQDPFNLLNYLIIVPLYLAVGTGFAISLFSLQHRLVPEAETARIPLKHDLKPYLSGTAVTVCFVLLVIFMQAGYAVDVTEKSNHFFWFHGETFEAKLQFNGYVYLLINAFLCGFVVLIALLHLEMFRWARTISLGLRSYAEDLSDRENVFLHKGDKLKEILRPFTETAIWSKAFAMLLALNIFTWQMSGVSGGSEQLTGTAENTWFFRFVAVLYLIIVLWLVSLPRYRVQYALFKMRQAKGVHEYYDIRMPWTIGWSAFIDLILLMFFSIAIFGSIGDFGNLIMSIIGGEN